MIQHRLGLKALGVFLALCGLAVLGFQVLRTIQIDHALAHARTVAEHTGAASDQALLVMDTWAQRCFYGAAMLASGVVLVTYCGIESIDNLSRRRACWKRTMTIGWVLLGLAVVSFALYLIAFVVAFAGFDENVLFRAFTPVALAETFGVLAAALVVASWSRLRDLPEVVDPDQASRAWE